MKKVCQYNRIMNEIAHDEKKGLFACLRETALQVSHSFYHYAFVPL